MNNTGEMSEILNKTKVNDLSVEDDIESISMQKQSLKKCQDWLTNNSSDVESEISSETCTSLTSNSTSELRANHLNSLQFYSEIATTSGNNEFYSGGIYKHISVNNSKKVHIGPATYLSGPIHVNLNSSQLEHLENEQKRIDENKYNYFIHLISRRSWLAHPPLQAPTFLEGPAKYVVICHTATEEGPTPPENMHLIRLIQSFHVNARQWDDIAYNFMIGSDGKIYEGRGWNVVGEHTYGFNNKSIGIAFVGSFINLLPPQKSLESAQKLIKVGVNIGAISENYSLVGHCQLSSTKSPGEKLYEEIKKWDNWDHSLE